MIKIWEKIWEWNYRNCHKIEWKEDLCIKIPKKIIELEKSFRKIFIHSIININQIEKEIYNKIPDSIKKYFIKTRIIKHCSISEIAKDYDWKKSKSIWEFWKINNPKFWKKVDIIIEELIKSEVFLFDSFSETNLFVKQISENEIEPIITDFKREWWLPYYLFQMNLIKNSEKKKKFIRVTERFKNKFKIKS